jgi:LysM repeat protein
LAIVDIATGLTALTAATFLSMPMLGVVAAGCRRAASMQPRVPGARVGAIVVLSAALGGLVRFAPVDAALSPPATRTLSPPVPPGQPEGGTAAGYVVVPGDSLWNIAERTLQQQGQPAQVGAIDRMWRAIYAANRAVIGDDPDLIFPGTHLTIPEERA